jgi:hypothetical protein
MRVVVLEDPLEPVLPESLGFASDCELCVALEHPALVQCQELVQEVVQVVLVVHRHFPWRCLAAEC